MRATRKYIVSAFVVFTFVAYAVHERLTNRQDPVVAALPTALALSVPTAVQIQPTALQIALATPMPPAALPTAPQVAAAPTELPTQVPTQVPTAQPTSEPLASSAIYKDGSYTGEVTDAYYGNVQVQAVIEAGKIASVQFLEYPNDRRTSIRINNVAMPYLVTEAIQAQTAQVDLISGATLTSEAFVQSLQSALERAKA